MLRSSRHSEHRKNTQSSKIMLVVNELRDLIMLRQSKHPTHRAWYLKGTWSNHYLFRYMFLFRRRGGHSTLSPFWNETSLCFVHCLALSSLRLGLPSSHTSQEDAKAKRNKRSPIFSAPTTSRPALLPTALEEEQETDLLAECAPVRTPCRTCV